jgi:predicted small metal-binding protein
VKQVSCECGYSTRSESEEQIVSTVLQHVAIDHPDLAPSVTPDVVRGWIEIVP